MPTFASTKRYPHRPSETSVGSVMFNLKIQIRMRTLELENYGVMEMNSQDLLIIDGEYSWTEFCNDAGYTVGYMVGAATNAANIAGNALKGFVEGMLVEKTFHKK